MNRKLFISSLGMLGGVLINPTWGSGNRKNDSPITDPLVKEFVIAGHNDLGKVKSMLAEKPEILFSTWDWGTGDFETAIEGAGHMGNVNIARYLIQKGARPNIFTLTMLGEFELVKSWIEKFPELLFSRGPHGFTLLHHAKVAGKNGEMMIEFFESKGLTTMKFDLF